ncbi:MAG: ABC transporter permease, partial [Rubrobacter sp.]|nr:ABC transporter permease [Rubrobacter sp.]
PRHGRTRRTLSARAEAGGGDAHGAVEERSGLEESTEPLGLDPQNFGDEALRVFLGGSFYSVDMLPPFWQTVTLFNPVVYLISGFRWSFYDIADVGVGVSLAMTILFLAICLVTVWWIFKTGYRLKT